MLSREEEGMDLMADKLPPNELLHQSHLFSWRMRMEIGQMGNLGDDRWMARGNWEEKGGGSNTEEEADMKRMREANKLSN
jgi:hypothetical protein